MITKLFFEQNGRRLDIEMVGTASDLIDMLVQAAAQRDEIASMILGTIPFILDKRKISRENYCKILMESHGKSKG